MKLYLDIDGVILTKDGKPAKHLKEFLKQVLSKYETYWLTTHCSGDSKVTLNYLSRFLKSDIIELLNAVRPTSFQTLKTEAIDFDSGFIWLDDYLFDSEIAELKRHSKDDCWIKVDLRTTPNHLLDLTKQL